MMIWWTSRNERLSDERKNALKRKPKQGKSLETNFESERKRSESNEG